MLHPFWRINLTLLMLGSALTITAQSTSTLRSVVIGAKDNKPNAILQLNPENKDQGFLLPQLTTAQRLAIQTKSPGDDGLMVFDQNLKEVFVWKNNAWATGSANVIDNSITNEVITQVQLVGNDIRINEAGKVYTQSLSSLQVTGDAAGTLSKTVVNSIQGNAIASNKLSVADAGKSLMWSGSQWMAAVVGDNSTSNETINNMQLVNNELRITEGTLTSTQNLGGLILNGDASGMINATAVTKIQGNPIHNAKLTTADNGKLLMWDGTQWVAHNVFTLNAAQFYTIDPSAFTILKPDGKADKHNMTIFESDDSFVTIHSRAEGGTLIAPINLPHGATLQQVALHYMDREAANIQIRLLRKSIGSSNEEIINWTTTGNASTVRSQTFTAFNSRQIIDNNAYTYRVEVTLNPTAAANRPSEANHRVYGVKIQYQP
ncbi:hypothetical protein [Pseudochryseolinea flava]|uniref:Uncharacterized protein n=1 Tax=Pseudochryseolinea flava TaxID=2059302 RepID=A0A364XVL6_9BACT|nr:hypothetical protein [Pseudochryseolinea flava]RAV98148.1 hypothetical protein DQQ10_25105 [Pseudochryseolinea flava]